VAGRCNASQDAQDATPTDQTQGPFLLMHSLNSLLRIVDCRRLLLTLFEYESLVWYKKHLVERTMSTSVAMRRSSSNQTAAQVFQGLSMFNTHADLMGLGWTPVAGLLEYEPTPIEVKSSRSRTSPTRQV